MIVPCLWPGQTVAIIASGPSATRRQAMMARSFARVIVINNSWQLAPHADLLYACDSKWWNAYRPAFRGIRITHAQQASRWGCRRVRGVKRRGLSMSPERLHTGGNSGYQALNLAVLMGAARILLIGFDMHGQHWHGNHVGMANPEAQTFQKWIAAFRTTTTDLRRAGVEVWNCTPGSKIDCFPRAPLEAFRATNRLRRPRGENIAALRRRLRAGLRRRGRNDWRSAARPVGRFRVKPDVAGLDAGTTAGTRLVVRRPRLLRPWRVVPRYPQRISAQWTRAR